MIPRFLLGGCLFVSMLCPILSVSAAGTGDPVRVWEESITLPTYAWHDDPVPPIREYGGGIYYPYSCQDHIDKHAESRSYRAVFLENEYLRITCLPELGGRIHSVYDKAGKAEMFHLNDVIKPALIAMRGAWIGGGIEWNPGPHGHTVTILSPVDVLTEKQDNGSAALIVGNTEKMFRTRWTVRLTLHPGKAYLDEEIRIYNPGDTVRPFYFWNCTAFPNRAGTRFIYPMTLGTDHHGREFFRWPVHEGKDVSWLKNYDTMTSVFAYDCRFDFFGAYDKDTDRGIVSHANHLQLPGKKAWTWGQDDFGIVSQMALSDAGPVDAQYIEVQSGPLLTQSDYGMLEPGRDVRWREYWYPVHGMGDGFEYATRDCAAQVEREKRRFVLTLYATGRFPGARCILRQGDIVLLDTTLDLGPEQAVPVRLKNPPDGGIHVTVKSACGETLLTYSSPLDIPVVEPPDRTEKPAREDGRPTADELYARAFLLHSQTEPNAAREAYLKVLEEDPLHAPSHGRLAALALDRAEWEAAERHALSAVARDPGCAEAHIIAGVSALWTGRAEDARNYGYRALRTSGESGRSWMLIGRAEMRLGRMLDAATAFERSMHAAGYDTRARNSHVAAMCAAGLLSEGKDRAEFHLEEDPTDFTLRAVLACATGDYAAWADGLLRDGGEWAFTAQEAAWFLADLGMHANAAALLDALLARRHDTLTHYHAAYVRHVAGQPEAARHCLNAALSGNTNFAFPSRPEDLLVFAYAVQEMPHAASPRLLYGHVLAAYGRLDEAVVHWRLAVELDTSLAVGWRLLGQHAWKQEADLPEAERCYRNAVAAVPGDQPAYRDLACVLEQQGRREEAIRLIEGMPASRSKRYDICLWLAQAYVDEKRYGDCIEFLAKARFSNWEGQTRPRDIFVAALMARGREAFEAGRYREALADFERALTWPENLEVGARYELTDAETRYWLGRAWHAMGYAGRARKVWKTGATQRTSLDPPKPFITITAAQDEYAAKCREALARLTARH